MELWERTAELMLRLIDRYDDQAIFLWLLVEETGFPLPLPPGAQALVRPFLVHAPENRQLPGISHCMPPTTGRAPSRIQFQ